MHNQHTSGPDIFDVSFEDYDEKVIAASHQLPILVDLWADWCMPCLVIAPKLKALIEEYEGRIRLAKLEVDEACWKIQGEGFPNSHFIRQWRGKGPLSRGQATVVFAGIC